MRALKRITSGSRDEHSQPGHVGVAITAARRCRACARGRLCAPSGPHRKGYQGDAQAKWQVAGSAPRSGRGGRRFKSCHSDQHLAEIKTFIGTDSGTVSSCRRSSFGPEPLAGRPYTPEMHAGRPPERFEPNGTVDQKLGRPDVVHFDLHTGLQRQHRWDRHHTTDFQLFCTTEVTISALTKQTTYEDGSLRPSPPPRSVFIAKALSLERPRRVAAGGRAWRSGRSGRPRH